MVYYGLCVPVFSNPIAFSATLLPLAIAESVNFTHTQRKGDTHVRKGTTHIGIYAISPHNLQFQRLLFLFPKRTFVRFPVSTIGGFLIGTLPHMTAGAPSPSPTKYLFCAKHLSLVHP